MTIGQKFREPHTDFPYHILDDEEKDLTPLEIAADFMPVIFDWITQGQTMSERGLRATVLWHEMRPDLSGFESYCQIADASGKDFTRQYVHKLLKEWRDLTNTRSTNQYRNKSAAKINLN